MRRWSCTQATALRAVVRTLWVTMLLCSCAPPVTTTRVEHSSCADAWAAWSGGDIGGARTAAEAAPESDERRHLLCLCAAVSGHHTEALDHYLAISPGYGRLAELDEPVIQAYLYDEREAEAEAFARRRGLSGMIGRLTARAEDPFRTYLDGVTTIPFERNDLAGYMPSIRAQIDGHDITAHLDTGAPHLVMGPDAARRLGIALTTTGEGFHATERVTLQEGRIARLTFGEVRCERVPVMVMPDLGDLIIIGTALLSRFLVTVDYPNHRLILSSRQDRAARAAHLGLLLPRRVELPFFCWSDHYLFAKGGLGPHQDLTFFIDSGLVAIDPRGRQACFTTSAERLSAWGLEAGTGTFVTSDAPLRLGSGEAALHQDSPLLYVSPTPPWTSFGGVRIDGLLGHGFLKRYQWTLDFTRHRFLFAER